MPSINVRRDTLDQENARFQQTPLTRSIFLNSVPKSGSHLLRNIMRMFVPAYQQYQDQFIQFGNMQEHLVAFDRDRPSLSWGHLFFTDSSAIETSHLRRILLYRDPYDWVLARARFFLSEEFSGNIDHLKQGTLSIDDLLSLMIFGIYQKAPPMADIYEMNAVAWLAGVHHVIRYEELVRHVKALKTDEAAEFFESLLQACGIERPDDWRERVQVGSDRRQSATASENLTGIGVTLPDELPAAHRRQVDAAAPGLRAALGYA